MATVPLSYTKVKILSGVPWTIDYKHTRKFNNKSEQLSYFNSKPVLYSEDNNKFILNEGKHSIKVGGRDLDLYDKMLKANYIMFQNDEYSDKWFYGFVTKIERLNSNVTEIFFALDLYQTWCFDWNFKPSFVVREHCPLWNSDGSPVINTIDEGLNYGDAYDDVHVTHFVPNSGIKFLVLISTKMLHGTQKEKSVATYNATAQPLTYYVLPVTLTGEPIKVMIGGQDIPVASPEKLLSTVYDSESSQKAIVSIFMTDSIGCPFTVAGGGETPYNITFTEKDQKLVRATIGDGDKQNDVLYVQDVKRYKTETFDVEGKYEFFPNYKESKLYMYPYSVLVVDDFKGNTIDYKLEYVNDNKLSFNMKGSMGTSNKVSYSVRNYNNKSNSTNHQDNQYSIINNSVQDVPVINDMLASYMQSNRNSLMHQQDQIVFNGMMGGGSAMLGSENNALSGRNNAFTQLGSGMQVAQGLGNTVLALQGMEAKKKDINNIPPSITKQGSNTGYTYGHRYDGFTLIKKTLKPEYAKKLSDFFNMFGYKKNEVKIPNFKTRQNWNYVETKNCNVTGDFNNEDLYEIKRIFDNGITLWHTDDIENYGLSNEPI